MNENELMRLAAQRVEWAGILIREIEVVCSVPPQVAGEVVSCLRDAIEEDMMPVWYTLEKNPSSHENGMRSVLRILGVRNMTLANYCAAVRVEIDAISYKG